MDLVQHRGVECLNFAAAYGSIGTDWTRHEAAMDVVAGILATLGFEWI
jgi:hypothetical protein